MAKRVRVRQKYRFGPAPRRGKSVPVDMQVIVHGFGELTGEWLIGRAVRRTAKKVIVQLVDDEGPYEEEYSLFTGKRTGDGDSEDGWMINLADLEPEQPQISVKKPADVKCLHREVVSRSGELHSKDYEETMLEVWESKEKEVMRYLKVYRHNPNADKVRQKCTFVPFTKLVQVLSEFHINW